MYVFLFYDQNPLPRVFGYLGFGFGVSYHSYLSTYHSHSYHSIFPVGIQLPFSLSVTNGTRVCRVTVVGVPVSALSGTRVYPATVVIIPGSATSWTALLR